MAGRQPCCRFAARPRIKSTDPRTDIGENVTTQDAHAARLVVHDDGRRNRLTVLFRLVLAIPHLIWFALWSLGALLFALVIWIATLVRGIPPKGLHDFYAMYVRYSVHLGA